MAAFELVFLGTGAADWPLRPGADVRYDVNGVIRRTSSLLINGKYLIDPAPESWFFAKKVLKLDLSGLKGIFLTHSQRIISPIRRWTAFWEKRRGRWAFIAMKAPFPG